MTREELIEELSDLQDYHTVTQRTCDFLKMDLLRGDDHYNAGNDSRIADMFEYLSPTEANFSKYIDYFAFAVVANLARFTGSRAINNRSAIGAAFVHTHCASMDMLCRCLRMSR